MATLGNTAKPTSSIEAWDGPYEIMAVALTLPAGGPWLITDVGVWAAGYAGVSCNARVCVWNSSGTLLASSATFTLTGQAFANGNVSSFQRALSAAVQVNGGTSVRVGLQVEVNAGYQFGRYSSGTHYDVAASAFPSNWGASASHTPAGSAWLVYESANVAPNAPVSLSPTGNAVVNSGTAPTVSGTRSDPDSGDYITGYQIVVYEDDGTTVIQDTGKVSVSGSPTTFSRALALNGAHKYVKWKARTWDKQGVAGAYSAQQRFYANAVPSTPGAPTVETDTLTPLIQGSFSDTGDTLAAAQIEVTLNASPYTSKWASGDVVLSGTAWAVTYAGAALAWSTAYRARYRVKDSHGAYSSWSSWTTFTPLQPAGPSTMSPKTTTPRLTDLTPDLTIGNGTSFRNHEITVITGAAPGATMWTLTWGTDYANVTSKVVTYAGTALTNGSTYYWRARIELNDGTITDWSAWQPFRMNGAPTAPSGLTPTGGVVISDLTPDLTATFEDPDLDAGDTPLNADIEVADNATGTVVWTSSANTGFNADGVVTYAGPALTYETTYKWRARFRDAAGLVGAYSAWQVFKVSQPPSATLTTPADASTVIESTPTLDWAFSSPGGKAQYSYRVEIFDKGPVGANYTDEQPVYDSLTVISSTTSHDVPFGVLVDGHDYRWQVTVADTDHLTYVLT